MQDTYGVDINGVYGDLDNEIQDDQIQKENLKGYSDQKVNKYDN